MRPTIDQVYINPEFFITLLEQQGEPAGRAKITRLMTFLVEYSSMTKHVKGLERERTSLHQAEQNSWAFKREGTPLEKKAKLRNNKRIAQIDRTLVVARGFLRRRERFINMKISKWPDLVFNPKDLKKKSDGILAQKVVKKRIKKGKPRTMVLA